MFIASPGDLSVERRRFKEVIDELNGGFAAGADAHLEPLAWELTYSTVGRPPQSVFNELVDQCDCFVLVLHRRWGQAAHHSPYSSYTEEEFQRALSRFNDSGAPRIFVFLKRIDSASMADPGPQLQKVLAFRRELAKSNNVIYKEFEDDSGFGTLLAEHLKALIKGDLPSMIEKREAVILPIELVERVERAEAEAERLRGEAKAARVEAETAKQFEEAAVKKLEEEAFSRRKKDLQLAQMAAKAALKGNIEEARQSFAMVSEATQDLKVLYLAYDFYQRIGELDPAESLLRRWLSITGPDEETGATAAAFGNLGGIYQRRGDLDRAEEMQLKSLAIHEKLDHEEGIAICSSNLGVIYQARGDLDRAEEMHGKALVIDEGLGRQEGVAANYGNLGLIYQTRGDPERAEKMIRKALSLEEKIGRQEGMATQYWNLGLIYQARGDIVEARRCFGSALALFIKLGLSDKVAKLKRLVNGEGDAPGQAGG